jgi:hypothetical protein
MTVSMATASFVAGSYTRKLHVNESLWKKCLTVGREHI